MKLKCLLILFSLVFLSVVCFAHDPVWTTNDGYKSCVQACGDNYDPIISGLDPSGQANNVCSVPTPSAGTRAGYNWMNGADWSKKCQYGYFGEKASLSFFCLCMPK